LSAQKTLRIRFKGSTVVTMDGVVLVEDDRIVAFGGSVQTDGAEIINGTGTIVAPDIIEAAERGSQPRCLELL
jgi:imidazolonepropionase-like amidohydrolase